MKKLLLVGLLIDGIIGWNIGCASCHIFGWSFRCWQFYFFVIGYGLIWAAIKHEFDLMKKIEEFVK